MKKRQTLRKVSLIRIHIEYSIPRNIPYLSDAGGQATVVTTRPPFWQRWRQDSCKKDPTVLSTRSNFGRDDNNESKSISWPSWRIRSSIPNCCAVATARELTVAVTCPPQAFISWTAMHPTGLSTLWTSTLQFTLIARLELFFRFAYKIALAVFLLLWLRWRPLGRREHSKQLTPNTAEKQPLHTTAFLVFWPPIEQVFEQVPMLFRKRNKVQQRKPRPQRLNLELWSLSR